MEKNSNGKVAIYDTTLRDGTQAEYFSLSLADKIRIARKLAEFGIPYIEGGWPGSNPKDRDFFKEIGSYSLNGSRLAAFGSTHHKNKNPENDSNLQELLISRTPVITIFGKSSLFQVKEVLQTTLERNLELITNSLAYLRPHVKELFYDAEHFFDAFKEDRNYALATLKAARAGGADCLILCDTNGGTLTPQLATIIQFTIENFPEVPFGIHAHNDSEMAVANSLVAVKQGCVQVQGTINGFGERCGNANLCSIIPALQEKWQIQCVSAENLKRLTELSHYVYEVANITPNRYQPYVGQSAFAHKGGIHAAAVKRNPRAYEHLSPEVVGNRRHIPVSDLSGKGSIHTRARELGLDAVAHDRSIQLALEKMQEIGLNLPPHRIDTLQMILDRVKELEAQGYQFESAGASLEMLLYSAMGQSKNYFNLISYRVTDQKAEGTDGSRPEATVNIKVGLHEVHTASFGNGPVNALFLALLKALTRFYPRLSEMRLEDYKVRVLPGTGSTDAKVRVHIESRDSKGNWDTVGVSFNIIEASWLALVDAINYKLFKDEQQK